jgi:hypothetical protein
MCRILIRLAARYYGVKVHINSNTAAAAWRALNSSTDRALSLPRARADVWKREKKKRKETKGTNKRTNGKRNGKRGIRKKEKRKSKRVRSKRDFQ